MKLDISSTHRKSAYGNGWHIAHPYKLFTSKYISYDDGFDGLYDDGFGGSYDSMYLLLGRAYLPDSGHRVYRVQRMSMSVS